MSIKRVDEDLQKRYSKFAQRERELTVYDDEFSKDYTNESDKNTWQKIQDRFFETRSKAIITGAVFLGVLILALVSGIMIVYFQNSFFKQEGVSLSVVAPKSADSNQLVEITFNYENKNQASLQNAEIKVGFGKYFVPIKEQQNLKMAGLNNGVIEIGKINPFSQGKITIAGHFVGPENFVENVEGKLNYQPEKTSTTYSISGKAVTMITSSPIVIDFESPKEIVTGTELDLKITCINTSRQTIKNIKLTIEYPNSFTFKNAEPNFVQNKVWFIDELASQGKQEFRLRGILAGDLNTSQKFKAQVETQADQGNIVYAINEYSPTIISAPIVITQQTDNKVVFAGNTVYYTIKFFNNSKLPIRDAILNLTFDSRVLNFEKLDLNKKGYYKDETKTITWKASDLPALKLLEPNDSGEVSFFIPLKENLPIQDSKDNNFTIETKAFIDSEDIPSPIRANKTILSNSLITKVGTFVPFQVTGKYKEGELPPRFGKETTYTLTMEVGSYNNDLKDAEISAILPTGVVWKGAVLGEKKEGLTFNERANILNWKIGGITHGEGLLFPTQKISFDVSIVPSPDQIGKELVLMQEIVFKGMDIFTQSEISIKHDRKTTNLEDGTSNGIVVE
jgi:hypothetical protein